jgi:cathepsin L
MNLTYIFCFPLLLRNFCYVTQEGGLYNDLNEFSLWREKHNKTYGNIYNISNTFNNWFDNKDFINNYNYFNRTHVDSHMLGLNKFADIHNTEWKIDNRLDYFKRCYNPPVEESLNTSLPNSVDWRNSNLVTNVKDQGQCGSCWAFSAVGSIEGAHAKFSGNLLSLSESQIVDCDKNGTDFGCSGGWMDGAFNYTIKNGGLEREIDYPYEPMDDPCEFNRTKIAASISSYMDVKGGENGLKRVVATVGPVSVAIDASNPSFQFYKSGVYYEPQCSQTMLDHGVLVVGYNSTENGTDYWIVKNSWGENWGLNGYIYMSRNRNNSCGIATKPSYPIV